jgi:hypothetical protein
VDERDVIAIEFRASVDLCAGLTGKQNGVAVFSRMHYAAYWGQMGAI